MSDTVVDSANESYDGELSPDMDVNYQRFLAEALATGCVWALEGENGWVLTPSVHNQDLMAMPLWSQPEFAQRHCTQEWSGSRAVPISVEELMDDWLPGMHQDQCMVVINLNDEMQGHEIEPLDLCSDVEDAASSEN